LLTKHTLSGCLAHDAVVKRGDNQTVHAVGTTNTSL